MATLLSRLPGLAAGLAVGGASLVTLFVVAGGCVDPHWDAVSWPAQAQLVAQPRASAAAAELELAALAMTWEPEAVTVELELRNTGQTVVEVDPRAILLAWDGLEFPAKADEAELTSTTIEPEAALVLGLRYQLGRPLESHGARLVLRRLAREGVELVAVPSLELPPQPTRD